MSIYLIDKQELTVRLKVSLMTIDRLVKAKKIEYIKIGASVRFTENHFENYILNSTIKSEDKNKLAEINKNQENQKSNVVEIECEFYGKETMAKKLGIKLEAFRLIFCADEIDHIIIADEIRFSDEILEKYIKSKTVKAKQ